MLVADININSFSINVNQRTFVIQSTTGQSSIWQLISGTTDSFIQSSNELSVTYTIDQELIISLTASEGIETSTLQFKIITESGLTRVIYLSGISDQDNFIGTLQSTINVKVYEGIISNLEYNYNINSYPLQSSNLFNINLITYSPLVNILSGQIIYNGGIIEDLRNEVWLQVTYKEVIDLKCIVCFFIDKLNILTMKQLYAIETCLDELEILKKLFRYFMILETSCTLYPNIKKEIQTFINKLCKIYKNCKEC